MQPPTRISSNQIALLSIATGETFRSSLLPCIQSHEEYCLRHNYQHIHHNDYDYKGRPAPWGKILALRQAFSEHPQITHIFWADADTLITNPFFKLETICEKLNQSNRCMLLAVDGAGNINTGAFLAKRHDTTTVILDHIWKQEQFINHCWWEQAALMALYPFIFQALLVTRDNNLFNSFLTGESPWQFGDFILHFAGLDNNSRRILCHKFRELIKISEPLLKPKAPNITQVRPSSSADS
jgi:hypothetical protein